MKAIGKFLARGLFALLILALLISAGGAYYFKRHLPRNVAPLSFPQTSGEISLAGLNDAAEIHRDSMGIPHIYASNEHDLFFAQGYIHAQDRFWQMDVWRHVGSGELSKMFGKGQVETDSFLRTLGWKQTAQAEWELLDQEAQDALTAYADGVNAYLKDHRGEALSLEYAVLKLLSPDYVVEDWTPIHSLTWGKAMAWDLRSNLNDEIERAVFLKTLTSEQLAQLYPPYPENHPVIVNEMSAEGLSPNAARAIVLQPLLRDVPLEQTQANLALLDEALGPWSDGVGSNSWVISGALTKTGKPLLANDPHLAIQMPSIWHQVSLHCAPCGYDVAGFSFAGVPGVVIGHNANIAWGFTNAGPDSMDLYIEKANPENPNQYEVNGKWVDFEIREEKIEVAGGEPVTIAVKISRHGPVISETYAPLKDQGNPKDKEFEPFKDRAGIELPAQYAIALSWTALSPSTPFQAIWGFDKASNWEEFRQAARDFHVPAQNLVYADKEGNIGYQMPGDVPIRKNGDGQIPVPGWTDDYEWVGFIPFEELPYAFNPKEGYIVTANNQVPPRDYPYFISRDWDSGFRAARIVELIESAPGKIDIPYIQAMQADSYDANAEVFVPLILNSPLKDSYPQETALLAQWNYQATADSAAAAIFEAFWKYLLQNALNDDLPERYAPAGGARYSLALQQMTQTPDGFFWDDKTTEGKTETMQDILQASFAQAIQELEKTLGKDRAQWTWGELHAATFENGTLGKSGVGLIEDLFNRGPFPTGGGRISVNATGWSVKEGYQTNWLPSMRMIADLSDWDASLTVHTTGQSGHAYHPHYDDMASLWAQVKYYPMRWSEESVRSDSQDVLRLIPQK